MTPLPADQIRVWRRPGALLSFWAWRWFAAWLVATPTIDAIAATGLGRHPRGDAALFEPGGLHLFEVARLALGALPAVAETSVALLLITSLAGLVPLGALFVALAHGGRLRFLPWASKALEHFPAFTLLAGASLLVQSALIVLSLLVFSGVRGALNQRFDERTADLSGLAAGAAVLLAAAVVTVLHDLSRAAAVRRELRAGAALSLGFRTLRTRPGATALGWVVPALLGLCAVGVAAFAVDRLAVDRGGSGTVSMAWLVHQIAAFALVVLRAAWLVRALRLVDSVGLDPSAAAVSR